jgi:nucleoside-diphosphate-sugar epimerase
VRILVTGNLGYIGPVLAAALTRAGHAVHGYDNGLYASFASMPFPAIAEQTIADLRDEPSLRRAVDRSDAIIQLAAMSNDPLGELDADLTRATNFEATRHVVELAEDRPLVVYSSASVYGIADQPRTESAPVLPLSLYSELKVAIDQMTATRPNVLTMRNGTVHGPAPNMRGELLLNAMVASAVTTGEVVLATTPLTRRPIVDVRDLADLTVGLLSRSITGLYNVASANISVGEAAAAVAALTGARIVERHDGADPRNYAMDTGKLVGVAGGWWRPRGLETSIRDLVSHYHVIGLSAADVETRRYHRIAQFRARLACVEP